MKQLVIGRYTENSKVDAVVITVNIINETRILHEALWDEVGEIAFPR